MNQVKTMHLLAGAAMGLAVAATGFANTAVLSADEIRAISAQVLADAETRSSLLQSGTAGYDSKQGGFFISSPDGAFRLGITGYTQLRYNINFGDDDNTLGQDNHFGFNMPNNVIIFHGRTHENIEFKIRGNFALTGNNANNSDFRLEDAFGQYNFGDGMYLRFGQFKAPFLREELVDDSMQLAVTRSITNDIFNQGRSQGVEFGWRGEDFGVAIMFSDGFRSANGNFTNTGALPFTVDPITGNTIATSPFGYAMQNGNSSDFAFTARGEWKFAGAWSQFDDFTFMPGQNFGGMLGLAGHVERTRDGATTLDPVTGDPLFEGETTLWGWTLDASVGGDGWNAFAAVYGLHGRTEVDEIGVGSSDFDTDDYGLVVQGGIFIPNTQFEIFGRYDIVFIDDSERNTNKDNASQLTIGANYYLHGHAAKFTLDFTYYFEDQNELLRSNFTKNYIGGTDDEFAVRAQFQFAF